MAEAWDCHLSSDDTLEIFSYRPEQNCALCSAELYLSVGKLEPLNCRNNSKLSPMCDRRGAVMRCCVKWPPLVAVLVVMHR